MRVPGGIAHLTNLEKVFFPQLKLTKRDLLQYYLDVAPWLLPHLKDRAMVMKRYPGGIAGPFFFMKRTPDPHPKRVADLRDRARIGERDRFSSDQIRRACYGW